MRRRALPGLALACTLAATTAVAAEFRATSEVAVLYDAPSVKGKPLFVLGRDYPLEVIVTLESWLKVRDAGGTVAWVERKALADRRTLVVRTPVAEILANADASAPLVFKAEQNVLLELVDQGQAVATPGWVKVRHRDGQTGFVRIGQVWGL
ncbi:MAG TPA: SH3 domain-containing protein [Casimicrobiaceae bacterium]|nr:SH3 domain-containing protein [Casimicrobiaceae bacterium]